MAGVKRPLFEPFYFRSGSIPGPQPFRLAATRVLHCNKPRQNPTKFFCIRPGRVSLSPLSPKPPPDFGFASSFGRKGCLSRHQRCLQQTQRSQGCAVPSGSCNQSRLHQPGDHHVLEARRSCITPFLPREVLRLPRLSPRALCADKSGSGTGRHCPGRCRCT